MVFYIIVFYMNNCFFGFIYVYVVVGIVLLINLYRKIVIMFMDMLLIIIFV